MWRFNPEVNSHPNPVLGKKESARAQLNYSDQLSGSQMGSMKSEGQTLCYPARLFVTTIDVTSSTKRGDILFSQQINPTLFANTNLALLAQAYLRCKIKRIRFTLDPQVAATNDGSVLMYITNDPDFTPPTGLGMLRTGFSDPDGIDVPVWEAGGSELRPVQTWVFTDTTSMDPRWISMGRIIVAAGTDFSYDKTVSLLTCEIEVDFDAATLHSRSTLGYSTLLSNPQGQGTILKPFGDNPAIDPQSNVDVRFVDDGTYLRIYLNPGWYFVDFASIDSSSLGSVILNFGTGASRSNTFPWYFFSFDTLNKRGMIRDMVFVDSAANETERYLYPTVNGVTPDTTAGYQQMVISQAPPMWTPPTPEPLEQQLAQMRRELQELSSQTVMLLDD
jgi:hypothetical protein